MEPFGILFRKELGGKADNNLGFEFTQGSAGNEEKTERILVGATGVAFCDVGRD